MPEGLSQPSVMVINQDSLGRMWFGTREGINIFDGSDIVSYKGNVNNTKDKSDLWIGNEVSAIVNDTNGAIYLCIDNNIISYDIYSDCFSQFTKTGKVYALSGYSGDLAYISNDSLFLKRSGSDTVEYQFSVKDASRITHLNMDATHYFVSTWSGLYIYGRNSHKCHRYLEDSTIYSTYISRDGSLWISLQMGGLYKMSKNDAKPQLVSMPTALKEVMGSQQTRHAVEDQYGRIWYGGFSGLFCYDPETGITRQNLVSANIGGLSHSSIFGLFCDKQGNIWAGSYYGGVNYFSPHHELFFNFDYNRIVPTGLFHSIIIDFVNDKHGNLWIGTDGGGVCCVDKDWNIVHQLSTQSGNLAIRQNNIKALAYDSENDRIFIGTHLGGLSYYDIPNNRMVNLIDNNKSSMPGDVIRSLKVNGKYLYVTSRPGFSRMNLSTGEFENIITPSNINKFDFDGADNLYYYNGNGVYKISNVSLPNPAKRKELIAKDIKNPASILANDKYVLIGTWGQGLYRISTDNYEVKHYTSRNSQLASDYCYAIVGIGNEAYIASDQKLIKINLSDESFKSIDFNDYFPESQIIAECGFKLSSDSSLIVGSTKGITLFEKEIFEENSFSDKQLPNYYFSELNVVGKEVNANDGSGILTCALPFAKEIRLPSDQRSFNLRIATSDFSSNYNKMPFRYKLDGVDKDWLTTEDGVIHYTNLHPGNYRLHVASTQDYVNKTGNEITLKIIIEHPWYATWWAWLTYIILAIGIILFVGIKVRDYWQMKDSLKIEKIKREQIERLNQEKFVFFTNVTHEFQTPLTLIMSHIDLLLGRSSRNEKLTASLRSIRSHVEQLSHLITQLLEFRKLQQNHQTLHIGYHNAGEILKKTSEAFENYSEKRGIDFDIIIPEEPVMGYFDPWLIDRVFVNLISNAFKYTPDGGKIELKLSKAKNGDVLFECKDTGVGISDKDLPFIFERFYNGEADAIKIKDMHSKTSGIGLAFAKSIVDHHHGKITVESRLEHGSKFTVRLPGTVSPFEEDNCVEFDQSRVFEDKPNTGDPTIDVKPYNATAEVDDIEGIEEKDENLPQLLIVEDNAELRTNLSMFFSNYYQVSVAEDGNDGLQKAKELNPDIIISDVLMPGMNGIEMCQKIKSDLALCHIPVILLTALSANESKLEGYNANADDYLTKPFDMAVLLSRVDNLLRKRDMMRDKIENKPISEIDISVANPLDRDLLKRVSEIIEEHLADVDLDVPMLCDKLLISRSLFYNKFKALTGLTPSAFILNYRLKHAAALLKAQPHLNITEIADLTGFSTTVYFARCFKKQFGVSPQKYRIGDNA